MRTSFRIDRTGLIAALFLGAPLALEQSGAAVLDIWSALCITAEPAAVTDASGPTADDHQNMESKGGLSMPLFSTPPKGGKVYNGPPLDEC